MRTIPLAIILLISLGTSNTFATTYFVKSDGNDNAAGTSDAQAWASISKVNSFSFRTGDDVYFKTGDTWALQDVLSIDWAGTADNRAVVGSYYIKDGSEIVGVSNGADKPTISGGYTSSTNTGTNPPGLWGGLVGIKTKYVTVQNLRIIDSSSFGMHIAGAGAGSYAIIENMEIGHTAGGYIQVYGSNIEVVIRNNVMWQCNWSRIDNINPYGSSGSHPACISFKGADKGLVEKNVLYDNYGEAIDFYHGADYNIARGNKIYNSQLAIYIGEGSHDNVIEQNIIVEEGQTATSYGTWAIAIAIEGIDPAIDATNNLIRNNLIAGAHKSCFYVDVWVNPLSEGRQIGGGFVGNTCIGAKDGISFQDGASAFTTFEVANNIFYDIDSGEKLCSAPTDTDIIFHHNSWGVRPTDVDCSSTDDVYGNPTLNTSTDFRLFSLSKPISPYDFTPKAWSAVSNSGQLINKLNQDFYGKIRPGTPTIGAIETGSISPPSGLSLTSN